MATAPGSITVTNSEKLRRLPWALTSLSLGAFFSQITFGSSVFVLYLSELGLPKGRIGFLLSLFPFMGISALLVSGWVSRFGYKRTFLLFYGARKLVILALLLTPWVLARHGLPGAFAYVAGVILVFAACRAIAETGYYPWFQEYVPNSVRGKFSAWSNVLATLSGLTAVAVASLVLRHGEGLGRYSFLILMGGGVGLLSVLMAALIPGGRPGQVRADGPSRSRVALASLGNPHFTLYLGGLGLVALGSTAVTFLPLFLKEKAGLSVSQIVMLDGGVLLGGLLFSYVWGWLADRYGGKPALLAGAALMTLLPLGWLFLPRQADSSFMVALLFYTLWGIGSAGYTIGSSNLLFNNIVPAQQKSEYMAVWYAWSGVAAGTGPLLAGYCLERIPEFSTGLLGAPLDRYTPLFLVCSGLMLAGMLMYQSIPVAGHLSARQLVRLLLHGNPLHAVGSLIGFTTARTVFSRRQFTARLGDTRNPLVLEELLEALHDPDFPVRLEAVLALSRMPPGERIADALMRVLDHGSPELRLAATWGLSKQGDRRALPALRQLVNSDFLLQRAHAARALAALDDREAVEPLLGALKKETDIEVRVAFVAALGLLRVLKVMPDAFALMAQAPHAPQRAELGLAAATLCGQDDYYLRLWRGVQLDPGTALAHALLAWKRRLKPWLRASPENQALFTGAVDLFAEENFAEAATTFATLLAEYANTPFSGPAHVAEVLSTCAARLGTAEGPQRTEYLLLACAAFEARLQAS